MVVIAEVIFIGNVFNLRLLCLICRPLVTSCLLVTSGSDLTNEFNVYRT